MVRATVLVVLVVLAACHVYEAKMLRNKALLSQMVSNFQRPKKPRPEPATVPPEAPASPAPPRDSVVSLMQGLLCKNFPDVPCDLIQKDDTLKNLISMSVREIQDRPAGSPPPRSGIRSSKASHSHSRKGRKNKRKVYSGGHKMSKFFPHKVKHVRLQPEWRIDYTRHGEPALPVSKAGRMRSKYAQHVHTVSDADPDSQ